jgi:hypothetical protein
VLECVTSMHILEARWNPNTNCVNMENWMGTHRKLPRVEYHWLDIRFWVIREISITQMGHDDVIINQLFQHTATVNYTDSNSYCLFISDSSEFPFNRL